MTHFTLAVCYLLCFAGGFMAAFFAPTSFALAATGAAVLLVGLIGSYLVGVNITK